MKAAFWHERWEKNELGFHQPDVNAMLVAHWPTLGVPPDAPVFVPLCGKSLDMVWLHEQGHPVIGVELSPIACRDFFAQSALDCETRPHGPIETWSGDGYTIHCGDFFALEPADLSDVRGVFDRGSLVALPPETRVRYAEHMTRLLPEGAQILLFTVVYDPQKMKGPPHSVPDAEVESLFGGGFSLERLASHGPGEPPPHFKARGLDQMSESIWRLTRRSAE